MKRASPEYRQAFVQMLRGAAEVGWSPSKIAEALEVDQNHLRNLETGFLPPSHVHLARLRSLMESQPPKRTIPPAPSHPVVKPPPFAGNGAAKSDTSPTTETGPAEPTEEPKAVAPPEKTPMETTSPTNGAAEEGHEKAGVSRYHHISRAAAKDLRRAMQGTLETKFQGSTKEMATAMGLSESGLRRMLNHKNVSMSTLTQEHFQNLTGWSRPEKTRAKAEEAPAEPPKTKVLRSDLLPEGTLIAFRGDLRREIEAVGIGKLADEMGVGRGALRLITEHNKGTSRKMLEKWERYQARAGKAPAAAAAPSNGAAPQAVLQHWLHDDLDLYRIAGRLLGDGNVEQARLLAMVARASEVAPLEEVTRALGAFVTK